MQVKRWQLRAIDKACAGCQTNYLTHCTQKRCVTNVPVKAQAGVCRKEAHIKKDLAVDRPNGRSTLGLVLLAMAGALAVTGCDFLKIDKTRFMDPSKVIASPQGTPINPILANASPADTTQEIYPNAVFPQPEDWLPSEQDYVIGANDIVDISVLDLYQQGVETLVRRQVSFSGFIDLPLLPQSIRAEGLTAEQLKEAIVRAYSPDVLREPTVSVMVVGPRQNVFSVLGAVPRPNTYNITRKEMRLLEALAMAGGVAQTNLKYMYVIRQATPRRPTTESAPRPAPKTPQGPVELPALPEIPTGANTGDLESGLRELGGALQGGTTTTMPATAPASYSLSETATGPAATAPSTPRVPKVIYSGGQFIVVEEEAQTATQPSGTGTAAVRPAGAEPVATGTAAAQVTDETDPFGWRQADQAGVNRIIAINIQRLNEGDPRMNVVVRDNDVIYVPTLDVGEFYVMGEVLRPGVYSLTGRQVTVKMAVAAAGNIGPLGWPENSVLIRRIGDNQEQIIPIDIEAMFAGRQPDMFLKANDLIAVGSDIRTTAFAVIRNAFRLTYGFGLIYDRNFAEPVPSNLDSRRFSRW
jgi:protein involved in polysaccharide export with SLBB domain